MSATSSQSSKLYTLIVVFFFWGFVAASNGIFIPFCKSHFLLSQFQSQLIDFTFYGGYFFGSLLLFIINSYLKADWLNSIGYKKGIIYGLYVSALGALSIIPAVNSGSFYVVLVSFFIVALGFSLQQTSSQPFVVALGSPETGAHRLNLAGAVNSFGTTIGPIIVSYFLFHSIDGGQQASISAIKTLYTFVAILFAVMAVFFHFSNLPDVSTKDKVEEGFGALKFNQLRLGMIAIFVYVGVEVTIQSNMGELLKQAEFGGYNESSISRFISLYWGSLMIGRWMGAISVFNLKGIAKKAAFMLTACLAFGVVLLVNMLHGNTIDDMYVYLIPVMVMVMTYVFLSRENQVTTLMLFSALGLIAMLIGLFSHGQLALFSFLSGGLACSVLWPCIFSTSIHGLGKYTSQGSALLIMMILGGAIIPPLQGKLADVASIGIHLSYIVTPFCFLYLLYFGFKMRKIASEVVTSGGH